MKDDRKARERQQMLLAANVGLTIAGEIVACGAVGYWADSKYGTTPRYVLAGLVLGLLAAGYELWKLVRDFEEK